MKTESFYAYNIPFCAHFEAWCNNVPLAFEMFVESNKRWAMKAEHRREHPETRETRRIADLEDGDIWLDHQGMGDASWVGWDLASCVIRAHARLLLLLACCLNVCIHACSPAASDLAGKKPQANSHGHLL